MNSTHSQLHRKLHMPCASDNNSFMHLFHFFLSDFSESGEHATSWLICTFSIETLCSRFGEMLSWAKKNNVINISNIATKVVPLCSVYEALLDEPRFRLLAPNLTKFVHLIMIFILDLPGDGCSTGQFKNKQYA